MLGIDAAEVSSHCASWNLAPAISRRDEEGFSSCSACPCHRAVASTPPRRTAVSVSVRLLMLPSPFGGRLGPRGYFFRGQNAFSFDTARLLVISPREILSTGFEG